MKKKEFSRRLKIPRFRCLHDLRIPKESCSLENSGTEFLGQVTGKYLPIIPKLEWQKAFSEN